MKAKKNVLWKRYGKYGVCVGTGCILFFLAEFVETAENPVEKGVLRRNPCGQGDAVYEFYVDGLGSGENSMEVSVSVPEKRMNKEQFSDCVDEAVTILRQRMLGENASLQEVCHDLVLEKEIPEFGFRVSWESEKPEIISNMGLVENGNVPEAGEVVYLKTTLTCGEETEVFEIPVTVVKTGDSVLNQFMDCLEMLAGQNMEREEIALPEEFDGKTLTYRRKGHSQNILLILLGAVSAGCLYLKEFRDEQMKRKKREDSLLLDYPDLVSGFLILTGAGYSIKQALKKMTADRKKAGKNGLHPVYEEMQITLNQVETGTPEVQAYAEFGKRCGLQCYVKLAALLESAVNTGGKNMRKLMEDEMEAAFQKRTDFAKRKGEEASTRLLIPMFCMLGVVMVMVVSPALLALG